MKNDLHKTAMLSILSYCLLIVTCSWSLTSTEHCAYWRVTWGFAWAGTPDHLTRNQGSVWWYCIVGCSDFVLCCFIHPYSVGSNFWGSSCSEFFQRNICKWVLLTFPVNALVAGGSKASWLCKMLNANISLQGV